MTMRITDSTKFQSGFQAWYTHALRSLNETFNFGRGKSEARDSERDLIRDDVELEIQKKNVFPDLGLLTWR